MFMTKEKRPRKKTERQLLIEALLDSLPLSQAEWAATMKMLNNILKKYPDTSFWFAHAKRCKYHNFKQLSWLVFNTNHFVSLYHDYTKNNHLSMNTTERVELEAKNVGEDIIVPTKPKTLKDFLTT